MSYDPNIRPETIEEWNQLVDHYFNVGQQKYNEEVAQATADAQTKYASLPDSADKPTFEQYLAQAVSVVEPLKDRKYWEVYFALYYPQPAPEPEPAPTLDELKRAKKAELDAVFYTACQRATVTTPDGWLADANETAWRNVDGLVKRLEAEMLEGATVAENGEVIVEKDLPITQFCGADNTFHEMNLEELRALQLQIIAKGQELYQIKWTIRSAIETAQDKAALDAIAISFA